MSENTITSCLWAIFAPVTLYKNAKGDKIIAHNSRFSCNRRAFARVEIAGKRRRTWPDDSYRSLESDARTRYPLRGKHGCNRKTPTAEQKKDIIIHNS